MRLILLACAATLGLRLSLSAADTEDARQRVPAGVPDRIEARFAEAERFYKEGSYKRAHEEYQRVGDAGRTPEERRWVQLRLAETVARSEASTRQPDDSVFRTAETELRKFTEANEPVDRVWAEAHEALGDLAWSARQQRNWGGGWPHYEQALEYWAGSTNVTIAAERYWQIIAKAARPQGVEPFYYYGYFGNYVPLRALENALKVARNEEERARAHFMIAMTLRGAGGEWEQRFRIPHEFEAAFKLKKDTDWYDDALYFYGEWMSQQGRGVQDENGNWSFQPDYGQALEMFQRIVMEFRKGETQWFDDAQNRIREITGPSLTLTVPHVFLPGSEIEVNLHWRNIEGVEFTLYKADLQKALSLRDANLHSQSWVSGLDRASGEKIKSWKWAPKIQRPHTPANEAIRLEEKLAMGAYLLVADGGQAQSREIVLVSDLSVLVESAGMQALVYVCDSGNGSPAKGASVRLWERYYDGSAWHWTSHDKDADAQGIALYELNRRRAEHRELLVLAKSGERQAFAIGQAAWVNQGVEPWKIYATTDRPAYRPGEKVQWKIVARRQRGETYAVPSTETVVMQINDPRGAQVRKEKIQLNSFGSGWGELDLRADLPLGAYNVVFLDANERQHIGSATLFRLEEYKLPEFKVAVQTPEENGKKKTFLLGEKVEIEVAADYYFGGPVANATVEVVVHQAPFYHYWSEPREYDWYFQEQNLRRPRHDRGQVVQREALKTDAEGKAKLTIQTPLSHGNDLEYRIEARVTDASRREIISSGAVRVTRQRFYVYPKPLHRIHKPQDKVDVEFKALDANDQPVEAEGKAVVTRDYWYEIWIAPDGREVKGDELKRLQAALFPPPVRPGEPGWRLKFRGYQHDEITSRTLKTGTNGLAMLSFTAEREGYYRVTWRSDENLQPQEGKIPGRPVRAEAALWVATSRTMDLGYRSGQVEILIDKDAFKAGEKAPVMLSVPGNDRHVLFTVSGNDLIEYQLVHMKGSVKLLELAIAEKHVPNAFLNATMVQDQQVFADQQEIVVPPVKNFLSVEVTPDREQYQPGEKGTLRITSRNNAGTGVAAEISLGVIDESVFYIQQDFAGDPRQFFFGQKRHAVLHTSSSFNYRTYAKLLPKDAEELARNEIDGRYSERRFDYFADGSSMNLRGAKTLSRDSRLLKEQESVRRSFQTAAPVAAEALTLSDAAVGLQGAAAPEPAQAKKDVDMGPDAPVQVRSDFRSTIFWQPDVKTDSDGNATVSFTYPDTLTTWRTTARAVTTANQFGIAEASTRTKQPLIVRLQAPRFFLVGDSVTISAVINNNTDEELTVTPSLEAVGIDLPKMERVALKIAPAAESRADWTLRPRNPGEIKLKVIAHSGNTAKGGKYADAMERSYTVYEHGIEKFLATSGKSRGNEVLATLDLPGQRREGSTRFTVQVTPSLAVTMLDALPYLVNYPYGCTEQTMSRFLPAAITARTLKDLGLKPEDVLGRVFGGIEEPRRSRDAEKNFDQLSDITEKGLQRLYDFQHPDGGWGWWKEGESDLFMSAYVVWGLTLARDAGLAIKADALLRGAAFLDTRLVEADPMHDLQSWMLHALAAYAAAEKKQTTEFQLKAFANLWKNRDQLNAYTRALFALSAHHFGKRDEAQTLIRNLANGVKIDQTPDRSVLTPGRPAGRSDSTIGTAHWGEDGVRWHWSEGGVEATAFALQALLAIDPRNELVEPTANWLIKNRRGAQWSNTRDTAIVLLALNDYLRVTREIEADLEYEIFVNNLSIGGKKIGGKDVFNAPQRFTVPTDAIRSGENKIRIVRKSGTSPIYFAVESTFFSLEEPITAAGNEIFVKRQYFRLQPIPTLLKGFVYEKVEARSGDEIQSGERIETVITIEAKNNYEYLVFEDLKPAGLEAIELRSGEPLHARRVRAANLLAGTGSPALDPKENERDRYTGDTRWVYQELRDRKVALFLDKLPEGFWEIRYEGRAEVPGHFHALPVVAHAMYVPEIRANSRETTLEIID
jgi:alpha-2-macroglobulin